MKIIHISTSDSQGGAARSAFRLHRALCALDEDSSMYVASKASSDPHISTYLPETPVRRRVGRALRKEMVRRAFDPYTGRPAGFEQFRDDRTEFGNEVLNQIPPADVINLHWIAGFIDYPSFFPRAVFMCPTIWTLHDMNPFTGGCHFDHSCGRFETRCGSCPQLGSTREDDLAYRIWARKKRIFDRTPPERLFLVAPSNWLAEEARKSSIFNKFPLTVIPYGIDTETFCPKSHQEVTRRALGVPKDSRVILFLADYPKNRRKGFALLDQALTELADRKDIFLVSLGKDFPTTTAAIPHMHLGSISNDSLLATIYSVADVFVMPSLQDNLPNTVLESMACGTPVVGFDAGGISDMIQDRNNGLLVPPENVRELATALTTILDDPELQKLMGENSRQRVLDRYSLGLQASRYSQLYQALVDQPKETSFPHSASGTSF